MNRWLKFAFSHAGFGNPRDVDVAESARGVLAHGARTVLKQARATDGGWGLAALWVTVALVSSLWLQHFFPYPFLFLFLGAVIASAWMGGPLAGALSVVLSTLCVEYFFVPPYYSFTVSATAQSYLVAFAVCASVACWLSATKRASEAVMRQARRDLEVRVAERTAEINASNRELRERERELHVLTEVIPQQIWSGTPDGAIDYCNQRLLDYVGLSMDEMRRAGFLATLHPEDRDGFRQRWQAALSSGQPFEGEWRVRGAEGRYRVFFSRSVPLRRVDGRVIRWYGTNTDIEEHKKAERDLMRTQANLAHLSRAFTMSALTTSIAHEINQPLTAVVAHGYACLGWLDATPPDLARARQTTERIIAEGTRAGDIIDGIRALFKRREPTRDWVDMNDVVRDLTVLLREEATRRGISIQTDLWSGLPLVRGDRVQLQQVVLNLVMNGLDAMDDVASGLRTVRISTCAPSAAEILVRVEDGGVGLTPETAERIFEPFYTTKPQGIGMGLAISRSIVEAHEGRLWAAPSAPQGAVLQFTLPLLTAPDGDDA